MTQEEIDEIWEKKHAGLKEGDLYIGSDGHHHHYHPGQHHHASHHHSGSHHHSHGYADDQSELEKRHRLTSARKRKLFGHILFVVLLILSIAIIAFVAYIYTTK